MIPVKERGVGTHHSCPAQYTLNERPEDDTRQIHRAPPSSSSEYPGQVWCMISSSDLLISMNKSIQCSEHTIYKYCINATC